MWRKEKSLAGEMHVFCTWEYAGWLWLLLCITILVWDFAFLTPVVLKLCADPSFLHIISWWKDFEEDEFFPLPLFFFWIIKSVKIKSQQLTVEESFWVCLVNSQIFEPIKWCDEVQRQIVKGILTHLSNYMLNWPKIICHPKALPLFSDPPLFHTLLRGTREAQNSGI